MANLMKGVIKLLFGTKSDKDRKEVEPYLIKIKDVYPQIAALSNDELRNRTEVLKESIRMAISADEAKIIEYKSTLEMSSTDIATKEKLSTEIDAIVKNIDKTIEAELIKILPEAFSIVKETARRFKENSRIEATATNFDRNLAAVKEYVNIEGDKVYFNNSWQAGGNTVTWDMVHYDSQLFGGVVLHSGKIAEMATGEGKTLVATLPIFLNALTGKGVHVVTVNDYLARRDSEWMGPIFEFHGLSIDCIDKHQPNTAERRKAYMADITYGTNNEFGFDYLRDNMANSPEELVQRKHHYAIVDEVDSVLIDDARTPLIISGPVAKGDDQLFEQYNPHVNKVYTLQKNLVTQVLANAKKLIAEGKTEEGGILLLRAYKGLPKYGPLIKYLSEQGNKMLLQKTEYAYMAENNKRMHEITDDLYFVIDEKMHSSDLTDKGVDIVSAGFGDSKFFILPELATLINAIDIQNISEEEKESKKSEIYAEYSIKSERIHTITQLLKAYAMFEKDVEYVVIDNKVKIVDEQTGRIMEGRRYSDGLHQAIEAKENVVVEAATQTFATVTLQNYFRMY
ncbi:MAG: preprotein translocase subunit SecA, partial [Rikenellaceae bacterium]